MFKNRDGASLLQPVDPRIHDHVQQQQIHRSLGDMDMFQEDRPADYQLACAAAISNMLLAAHALDLVSLFNKRFGSQWIEDEKTFWGRVKSGEYQPKPVI